MQNQEKLSTRSADYGARTPASAAASVAARELLPGGHSRQTLAYRPYPFFTERGEGCYLHDIDGGTYLDLVNNYTSLIHGHAHAPTVAAIAAAAARSSAPGTPTELELAMAEELVERVPSLEQVRFAVTGSEAVGLAIRLGRAHTRRPRVLKFEGGFHGVWDEVQQSIRSRPLGPGEFGLGEANSAGLATTETVVARYNDLDSVRAAFDQLGEEIGVVIAEPFLGNGGLLTAVPGFLAAAQDLAHDHGAVFVLDEIQSCRLAVGGAQSFHRLEPDLTTLGKTIGGGLPLAAFGGRGELMAQMDGFDPEIPQPGTFNAFPLSLAAGLATLDEWRQDDFARLAALGETMRERTRAVFAACRVPVSVAGQGSMFHVSVHPQEIDDYAKFSAIDGEVREMLHRELLGRGIYLTPRGTGCLSTPMSAEQIDQWADALGSSLESICSRRPDLALA